MGLERDLELLRNLIGEIQTTNSGKTILTASGTTSSSGATEMVAAVTGKKIKVIAYAFTTVSATKDRLILKSAATEIWRPAILQSAGDITTGANLAVPPPGQICETAVAEALNLVKAAAVETDYAVAYYTEA